MYQIIKPFHNYLHYLLIFLLIFLIGRAFYCWQRKLPFSPATDKISLYTFIVTHTQLLLGLILYIVSPKVDLSHFKEAMHNPINRFWTVEHITVMIIAVVLISIARISMKKLPNDISKHKRLFFLNTIALLCIISALPYLRSHGIGADHTYLFGIF